MDSDRLASELNYSRYWQNCNFCCDAIATKTRSSTVDAAIGIVTQLAAAAVATNACGGNSRSRRPTAAIGVANMSRHWDANRLNSRKTRGQEIIMYWLSRWRLHIRMPWWTFAIADRWTHSHCCALSVLHTFGFASPRFSSHGYTEALWCPAMQY